MDEYRPPDPSGWPSPEPPKKKPFRFLQCGELIASIICTSALVLLLLNFVYGDVESRGGWLTQIALFQPFFSIGLFLLGIAAGVKIDGRPEKKGK